MICKANNQSLVPQNEPQRLAAVQRYEILDTPPDGAFDSITWIAAQTFEAPIAIVSIVDSDRIWFKSSYGLPGVRQIDRQPGLCASAILQDDVWMITNARVDPRTLANPLVAGEFNLQFYVGIPLKTQDGYNIGVLCVIDKEPRLVKNKQVEILKKLAAVVVDELELRLSTFRTLRAQQLEVRVAELEELNRLKDDFLSTVSHELRTPMTTMRMALQMTKLAASEQKRQQYLSLLEGSLEREIALVEDLLNLQQLEAGARPAALKVIPLQEWLPSLLNDLIPETQKRHQTLVLNLPLEGLAIRADEELLRRSLQELIHNAGKYSPEQAEIVVKVCPVMGEVLELIVSNPNAYIPEKDIPFIFDKFYRVIGGDRWKQGGTGLGLSLVKKAIEHMGGNISVKSDPEQTEFILRLAIAGP